MTKKNEAFKAALNMAADIKTLVIGEERDGEFRELVRVALMTEGSPFFFRGEGAIVSSGTPNAARVLNGDGEVLFPSLTVGTDAEKEWRAQLHDYIAAFERGEAPPVPRRRPMPHIVLERPHFSAGDVLEIHNMMVKPF
jgi:hypothetical protein